MKIGDKILVELEVYEIRTTKTGQDYALVDPDNKSILNSVRINAESKYIKGAK